MTENRVSHLKGLLTQRINTSTEILKSIIAINGEKLGYNNDSRILKELISNTKKLDLAQKEVAIDYLNYLHINNLSVTSGFELSSKKYITYKMLSLESICSNSIFISDYYGVLKNIFKAINNPSDFYDEYNIELKFELLYATMAYATSYLNNEELQGGKIPRDIYIKRVNKVLSGHRLGEAVILIDEGQDCHRDEKDILYKVFFAKNIAVANGGKEQLIRHVELCNWTASKGISIPHKIYSSGNKSYRLKKRPLHICNFIANRFNVELDLIPLETEDHGEVIIDFRQPYGELMASEIFENLLLKGEVNFCCPYESLLILLNPSRKNVDDDYSTSAIINEYGNIEEHNEATENVWQFMEMLGRHCEYWDGTNDEIRNQYIPAYGEVRTIFYNSCRGLEAWSVACFDIDKFFDKKRSEKDAEIYLMDTVFTLEERKSMYASTWALMAMTRAIDTLYLKISDKESEFGKAILEYTNTNPGKFKIYQ